ncbi:hypothetical protein EBR66_02940 [bacterium]|nr:hypothetical protein [bacterium]
MTGHGFKRVEEFLFDWLLYGAVTWYCNAEWGPVYGSLAAFCIMAPLSACVSFFWIAIYNAIGKDWLGLELLKELKRSKGGNWFTRKARAIVRSGKGVPAFFVLSFWTDPFMTTVYFRKKGETYTKLTGRDTNIFWCSVFVSNTYWTVRWSALVQLIWYVWDYVEPVLRPLWQQLTN